MSVDESGSSYFADTLTAPRSRFRLSFPSMGWLLGEVEITREELDRLLSSGDTPGADGWYQAGCNLLVKAVEAATAKEGERAWLALKAARREAIRGYSDDGLSSVATALLAEAEKIDVKWRREAIINTLKTENSSSSLSHDQVVHAQLLRDDHYDNFWRKVDRRRKAIIASVSGLTLIVLTIIAYLSFLDCSSNWVTLACVEKNGPAIVFMALWGGLGASLSASYTLIKSDLSEKFPEGALSLPVIFSRPFIGAASAIVVMAFIKADIINIGNNEMTGYVTGFLSGFSERFFFSVVSKEGKKTS